MIMITIYVSNRGRGIWTACLYLVVTLCSTCSIAQTVEQPLEQGDVAIRQVEIKDDNREALPADVEHVNSATQESHPNLLVDVSERFVAAGMAEHLEYTDPINDCIFGAAISGQGHTTGEMKAELVTDPRGATLRLTAQGRTDSKIVGRRRRVTVWGDGATTFVADKTLTLDESGFRGGTARSRARSDNWPRRVSAPPLVQGMAWWYLNRRRWEGNRIAARHAEPLISDKVDEKAGETIRSANEAYDRDFRNPLLRHEAFPQQMDFSTSSDELNVVILQAAQGQIGAPQPAPLFNLAHDIGIRMHETAFNNLSESLLGGQTMTDEEFRANVSKYLTMAKLDKYTPEEDEQPWSVTFAPKRPVSAIFDNETYSLVVAGQRWTSGQRRFRTPMNVTVTYRIESNGGKVRLARDQEVLIAPPGFVRGQGRLSPRDISLRRVLQRKFDELFPPIIDPEDLVVPGPWEKAGPLNVVSMSADSGWLQVSWEMQSGPGVETAGERVAVGSVSP